MNNHDGLVSSVEYLDWSVVCATVGDDTLCWQAITFAAVSGP